MLSILWNPEKNRPEVDFSGDDFHECLEFVKENKLTYDPNCCKWTGSNKTFAPFIEEVRKEYPELYISQKVIDFSTVPKETIFYRRKYKEELLQFPVKAPFQKDDIIRGITQNRLALFHEMGMGKTFISSNIANHLIEDGSIGFLLIICPSEALYNWRREYIRFSSKKLTEDDFYIADVDNREPFTSGKKIVIMTPRTFVMLSDDAYKKKTGKKSTKYRMITLDDLGAIEGEKCLIVDESHFYKNHKSRRTKVLCIHKHFFKYRYIMSGTPDPNGIEGYYSQMNLLDESIISADYYGWLEKVADLGDRFSKYNINFFKADKVKEFMDKIKPWVIRRFSKDHIDLPPLTVKNIYVPFRRRQVDIYKALISHTLSVMREEDGIIVPKKVEMKFPYLSLALDNPSILKGKIDPLHSPKLARMLDQWKIKYHAKMPVLEAMLEDRIKGQGVKVIVWDIHPITLNELTEYFAKYKPLVIHGQVELPKGMKLAEYKDNLVQKFRTDPKCNLLFASSLVLSTAITITECHENIVFARSYDYTYWAQMIKRTHRIGQEHTVNANPILIEKSLDLRLNANLSRKAKLDGGLFSSDSMSSNEWRKIFEADDFDLDVHPDEFQLYDE